MKKKKINPYSTSQLYNFKDLVKISSTRHRTLKTDKYNLSNGGPQVQKKCLKLNILKIQKAYNF